MTDTLDRVVDVVHARVSGAVALLLQQVETLDLEGDGDLVAVGHRIELLSAQLKGLAGALAAARAELAAIAAISTAFPPESTLEGPGYDQPALFRMAS